MSNQTIDKSQPVAHKDHAMSTVSVKKNCVVHSWPCGCKRVVYRPNGFGQQTVQSYFCNTGGRSEAKRLIKGSKKK